MDRAAVARRIAAGIVCSPRLAVFLTAKMLGQYRGLVWTPELETAMQREIEERILEEMDHGSPPS